jgi:indole-3-glycerol phosphate synthase
MKSDRINILDQIVAEKKVEVARLRLEADKLKQAALARKEFRDFARALRRDNGVALIAEIKKASPSAGVIQKDFDAIRIALDYEQAGASALSVLTDQKFFQGRIEYLPQLRDAVKLPLLRKDFIIDELQLYESAAYGADAILLIVAILDDSQLKDFREMAEQLHLASLVEVHDEVELDRAVTSGAGIIGVNNRDLRDFSVDLATTEKLAAKLRRGMCPNHTIVAESGIHTRADVERLAKAGVNAVLVGESLMRSGNIQSKARELMGG